MSHSTMGRPPSDAPTDQWAGGAANLSRRRFFQLGGLVSGGLVLAACGDDSKAGQGSGSSGTVTVKLATSVSPDFSQVPLLVGTALGTFEEAGAKVTLERMAGNVMPAALLSGGVNYASLATSANFAELKKQGRPAIAIARQIFQNPNNIAVRKQFLEGKGVDASSPIADRLKALKGARWASISPASASSAIVRYLMGQAGYREGKDYTLTYINSISGFISAMQTGQIDAFAGNTPSPQQVEANGAGLVYINLAREKDSFPAFKDMTWSVLWAIEKSLQESPGMAEKTVLGLWRAQKLIQDQPDKAKAAVRPVFKDLDDALFERCWNDSAALYPPDPRMDAKAFELGLLLAAGKAGQEGATISTDGYFTNKAVDAVQSKV